MSFNHYKLTRHLVLATTLLIPFAGFAATEEADMDNGEEINEVCAGCHGEYAQGGGDGKYPRLAGLPKAFIEEQMHLFRSRLRPNMPMVEHVDERQMPDQDIADISAFIAAIKLKTKLPPVDETAPDFNAYERLLASKQLMQIPRAPGDIEAGGKMYKKECKSCHGATGEGDLKDAVPMLSGQFTDYLWLQVDKYIKKIRVHDKESPDESYLAEFTHKELEDMLAFLSVQDD